MAQGFFARLNFGRGPATQLEADLRRITEADLIDTPSKDALLAVTQSTHVAEDRREILRHLQECLAEASGGRWRRVHGGLVLLDELLKNGSPTVVSEIAEGMHFDPIQRLTFLERFEYKDDRRVQDIVRKKATALRAELISRLHHDEGGGGGGGGGSSAAAGGRSPPKSGAGAGSASAASAGAAGPTGSDGGRQSSTTSPSSNRYTGFGSDEPAGGKAAGSDSAFVGFGSDDFGHHLPQSGGQESRKKVNGLVAVGHRDDTDSDDSDDRGRRRQAADKPRSGVQVHSRGGRNALEDSTDSDSDGRGKRREARRKPTDSSSAPAKPKPPPPPVEVDLLGGFDTADAPASSQPAPAAQAPTDLLEF